MIRNHPLIHTGLLYFLIAWIPIDSAIAESNLAGTLKQSMRAAEEVPLEGTLSICCNVPPNSDEQFVTKVKIERRSPDRKRMEIILPEILNGHRVVTIGDNLWVTPMPDDIRKKLPPQFRFHHWFRVFHDLTGLLDLNHYDLLLQNYNLIEEKTDSVVTRQTQVIYIQSKHLRKDRKRPSMRFWIDNETLMPLKSQRFNSEERLLETIQFDEIHFDRNDSAAEINTDGLTKLSPPSPQPNEDSEKKIELDFHPLKLEKIPMGFKEIAASIFPKNNNIVLETNYTDGLATFSTYQRRQTSEEKEAQAKEPEKERWKVKKFKDKDIYYREIEGIRIVVVGELDECSMNYILYNMQAENPHPRSDSDPGRHE